MRPNVWLEHQKWKHMSGNTYRAASYSKVVKATRKGSLFFKICLHVFRKKIFDRIPSSFWKLNYLTIVSLRVTDCLFHNHKVSQVWKAAGVSLIPKTSNIIDFNKDPRPILLTSTLSKIAEEFVIDHELKPETSAKIDPHQFGFIPKHAQLTLSLQCWMIGSPRQRELAGNPVRVAFLNYRKAFDLVSHTLLIAKLANLGIRSSVVNWIFYVIVPNK